MTWTLRAGSLLDMGKNIGTKLQVKAGGFLDGLQFRVRSAVKKICSWT